MMSFKTTRSEPLTGVVLLELHGSLDASVQDPLTEALRQAIREAQKGLLISLRNTEFIDSSGIGSLLRAWGEAENEGLRFGVVFLSPRLQHLLDALGVLTTLPVFPTVSDALKEWEIQEQREVMEEVREETGLVTGVGGAPPPPIEAARAWMMEIRLGCDPKMIQIARLACAGFASQLGLGLDEIEDIKLAVSEACTNVLQHAYQEPMAHTFTVRCRVEEQGLVVEVVDQGKGLPPDRTTSLGTMIMTSVMDDVRFLPGERGGTVVRMVKRVRFTP